MLFIPASLDQLQKRLRGDGLREHFHVADFCCPGHQFMALTMPRKEVNTACKTALAQPVERIDSVGLIPPQFDIQYGNVTVQYVRGLADHRIEALSTDCSTMIAFNELFISKVEVDIIFKKEHLGRIHVKMFTIRAVPIATRVLPG